MHTIFHRYHNNIEERLHAINPSWGGEKLFQETRRIVGAVMQHTTYNELVPIIVGEKYMRKYKLKPLTKGFYNGKPRLYFI